jgi:hypothetical protein
MPLPTSVSMILRKRQITTFATKDIHAKCVHGVKQPEKDYA